MNELLIRFINTNLAISWLIFAVLILRGVFRKVPRRMHCILWGMVAVRLVLPIMPKSAWSIKPQIRFHTISQTGVLLDTGNGFSGSRLMNFNTEWVSIFMVIWLVGGFVLLAYGFVSNWMLLRRMRTSVLLRDNIRQSEYVTTPFVMGVFQPIIYLPFRLEATTMEYVIAHEKTHISRKDHLTKLFGYLVLCVFWVNPLIWVAYASFCKDLEMACDESVIREYDGEERVAYSQALLTCSVKNQVMPAAGSVSFGTVTVKKRVRYVLNYKKPKYSLCIAMVGMALIVAVGFMTEPKAKTDEEFALEQIEAFCGNSDYNIEKMGEYYYFVYNMQDGFIHENDNVHTHSESYDSISISYIRKEERIKQK